MGGWVKLHRKLLRSPLYKSLNSKQRDVMIQCFLLANHEETEWGWGREIYKCLPGQFITSLESLKSYCAKDIQISTIRSTMIKLELHKFLTNKSTKTGRLITIVNWDKYQNDENKSTNKSTDIQQTFNIESTNKSTTNKNNKEIKKYIYTEFYDKEIENNKDKLEYNSYCSFVSFLFGVNELNTKLECWLKLRDQMTYNQYEKLVKKAREKKRKISEMLISGYNKPKYTKGNTTIYGTLNAWINRNEGNH